MWLPARPPNRAQLQEVQFPMPSGHARLPLHRLGRTNLEVTIVGFGGIPIQIVPEEVAIAAVRRAYDLDQRTCRRCRYCEPCPQGVHISSLLHGRSVVKRMGAARWRQWGALEMIASADLCTECGECLRKCPYHLPIPELIREVVAYLRTIPELTEG